MRGIQALEKILRDTYIIVDPGIIRVICASVISNRIEKLDPIWLFIVAASGGGKTEFINALSGAKKIIPVSSLTSRTFISGAKVAADKDDPSLLFRANFGIITIKDFTTYLSMGRDERQEIMAQFREIYDGSYNKIFGTGENITWEGKIGLIAGCTYAIYSMREMYSQMGERFIMYAIKQPDRNEVTYKAIDNALDIREKREEIKKIVANYLDNEIHVPDLDNLPKINDDLKKELVELSELATRARSPVNRNWRSPQQEIISVDPLEMPTRFASQLIGLATGLMIMNENDGKSSILTEIDKNILYKISLDSISFMRRKVLQELTRYEKVETSGLATEINLPTSVVNKQLQELNVLGLCERIKGQGRGNADSWELKQPYRAILERFEGIEMLNHDLISSKDLEMLTTEEELLIAAENNKTYDSKETFDPNASL